jgi:general secretion pathway protein B
MSYILEALKRADAERERGHVPGLHTRTTPELDAPAAASGSLGQRGRLIALGTLTLLVLGAALWWWLRATPPVAPVISAAKPAAQVSATQNNSAPSSPIQQPEPEGSRRSVASETARTVLPILSPPPPPSPAKAASASPPTRAAADAQRPSIDLSSAAGPQPNASSPAPGGAPAATASASAAAVAVQSFAELSPEARSRLPAVNVSGSTYSKNPTLRMLIVNGKVVQEGGEIGPGLTLETIEQRSAVLNHQGLRYRIGY